MVLESNTLDFLFLNDGEKGVPGEKGDDGKTLYTWIKYSQNSDGSNMTDDPTDAIYIGLSYNNESATESNNPSDYKWTKIKGNDGEQGNDAYSILLTNENISFATRLDIHSSKRVSSPLGERPPISRYRSMVSKPF